jgi:ABC-type Fe3+-siderophore transport system permease subunit
LGVVESKLLLKLALIQGLFYLATGVWPLIDIESFQVVTGPKTDLWLVRTVGVLVAVVGAVLIAASRNRRVTPEIVMLAVGAALGLAAIDLRYALTGRISPVYLADAMVEIALSVLWWLGWRRTHAR